MPRLGTIAAHATLSNRGCTDCEYCLFYFFVFETCLALAALFFSCLPASAFICFCTACLCVAFGDLSPMIQSVRSTGTGVNRRLVRFLLRQLLPTYLPVNLKDLSPMTPIGQIHSIVEAKNDSRTSGSRLWQSRRVPPRGVPLPRLRANWF